MTSAFSSAAYAFTFFTFSFASGSAISSSLTLAAYRIDLLVNNESWFTYFICSSVNSNARAGFSASRPSFNLAITSNSATASFSFCLASFSVRSYLLFTVSKSDKINSRLIISISSIGSIFPETCVILSSWKQRTTGQIASTWRILDRNWVPNPSPLLAPSTIPAISVNSNAVGTVFFGFTSSVNLFKRSSGTSTIPTFGSIVQNG